MLAWSFTIQNRFFPQRKRDCQNKELDMKNKFILIIIIISCSLKAFAWDQPEARKIIKYTQKILIKIDNNLEIRSFIPYDIYGDALTELIEARSNYNDGNYTKAYYLAAVSSIKLETISLLADAKKIREKTIILERDYYRQQINISNNDICTDLLSANVQQKGDAYVMVIYDKDLFQKDKKGISEQAQHKIAKLINIMAVTQEIKITIAGHTSKTDYKDFSKFKAELISKHLQNSGISADRITTYGMGTNEVMNTPWGFKNIDRVELILHGISKTNSQKVDSENKPSGIGGIKVQ